MRSVIIVAVVAALLFPVLAGAQESIAKATPKKVAKAVPVVYTASIAFDEHQPAEILVQRFEAIEGRAGSKHGLPKGAVVPMSEECPDGWSPYLDADGRPLFFPFGLIVDEEGNPHVASYALLRACEKQ